MAVAKQPICASTNSSDREFSLPFRTIDSVPASGPRYGRLDTANHQVRLFRLHPHIVGSGVNGSFIHAQLQSQLQYIALSYTWGSQSSTRQIGIEGGDSIDIGENLWDFLQIQNRTISEPTLFWIDAICINQSDVHERNHQVGLMKQIYANAAEVFVWLGKAADDSDVAVRYLTNQASKPLRQRAQGYYPLWSEAEGRSLSALCERPYWRRMWIIQELLHAGIITVWCGSQHFAWTDIESLYLKLKEIERSNWFAHHRFHMAVMQSSAAVMLWQRAHWRHPKTPVPHLQTLIEIFKDWQCSDVRDKVFALVGMATQESAIVPDYGLSTKDMYLDVVRRAHGDQKQFGTLLSQILGLAGTDIALAAQEMIQYKTHSPEKLVFRARLNDWSDRSDHLS
ncbi:heterokaryon incompatibility protein-domain-containing protein [Xylariales sp. PMI_506]|nr:heterokaryon incompatibility protein-domain-containing protein [Xylariales sp. PMI_506]